MVQTFGKRILGGIGAPGGGMSKAYAEGVTTGINQRVNRQSMAAVEQDMRLAEQDQAFKIEDREEAKRRRAAAEAAAGAARARSAALARALAGTVGKAPGVTIPPGQTYGPRVSVGGPISATPPTTRTPVASSPPLSFKLGAAGATSATGAAGAAGQQVSEAPMNISNIEFVKGVRPAVTPGVAAAPNPMLDYQEDYNFTTPPVPGAMERIFGAPAMQRIGAETSLGAPTRGVPTPGPAFEGGGRGALQQNVTIMGPAGPIVMPVGEAYPTGTETDGESAGRAPMALGVSDGLSFGPALGAPEVDINASVVDRVAANPPGQPMSPPNTELFIMEPGRSGRELQQAYNEREELVRQIGIYSEYGEYGEVAKLVEQVKTIDNNLYLLQGMQGIQELQFNSPQRLQMVLSEQLGRNIGIQANDIGGYDLFVDGQLAMQLEAGNGENSLAYWARSQIDSKFVETEAARAAEYNLKAYENQLAIQQKQAEAGFKAENILLQGEVDMAKQQVITNFALELDRGQKVNTLELEQYKQGMVDAGLLPADANLQVEKTDTGTILIIDMETGDPLVQYIPTPIVDENNEVVGTAYKELAE